MKDYLYIPLGGNRVTKKRLYFNLFLVFIISGFWHGASWNFIIWGAFHGTFLILDRLLLLNFLNKIGRFPSLVFTFFIVLVGWTIFRIENLTELNLLLSKMFQIPKLELYGLGKFDREFYIVYFLGFTFAFLPFFTKKPMEWLYFSATKNGLYLRSLLAFLLFALSFSEMMSSEFNPFIYFRF